MTSETKAAGRTAAMEKVPSGIAAFDELTMGGLPRGRATLLGGTPGSGKTVFATQFLAHGLTACGENGVFVTFEEAPEDIELNMRGFGWDLVQWREEGRLAFVDVTPPEDDHLVVGEFDLSGLVARIENSIKTINAKRVVVDSITQLFDHFIGDEAPLRRELFRVSAALKRMGLAVLMTAERDSEYGGISRHRMEEFVADNVIVLRNVLHEEKRRRTMEVLKLRGSNHIKGEAPFTIVPDVGVVATPLSSLRLEQRSSMVRITSGNPDLDEMCSGGFFRDSVTLVSGATGTGKTLLVTNFLAGGIKAGERALMVGYEESRGQLFRNARGWGVDFEGMERAGTLHVVCMYPETQDLQAHLLTIQRLVNEYQPSRIAIDSLSALERVSSETGFREFLINLTSFIKKREIAGLYSATSASLTGGESVSEQHISTLTDSIILLRYIQHQQTMHRGLIVLKMRGSEHAKEIREFTIDGQGMHLGVALDGVPGVLGDQARTS